MIDAESNKLCLPLQDTSIDTRELLVGEGKGRIEEGGRLERGTVT